MIQLTADLVKDSFVKTGFDMKYFPVYEEKVNRVYKDFQSDLPDDEETLDDESNVTESIRHADIYIAFYVEEIEKGHSENWASSYADNKVSGEKEFYIVEDAYNSIVDKGQKEKDLDIYISSLSSDDIFRERYKFLFHDHEFYSKQKAAEYCEIYHRCIKAGKSVIYAHAFANEANNYFDERGTYYNKYFVDIHAEAVEQAIEHGMDEDQAYLFGDYCSELYANGFWWTAISNFLKQYHEDWQKEFFLYLYSKDYMRQHNREVPESELNDLRRELDKQLTNHLLKKQATRMK